MSDLAAHQSLSEAYATIEREAKRLGDAGEAERLEALAERTHVISAFAFGKVHQLSAGEG